MKTRAVVLLTAIIVFSSVSSLLLAHPDDPKILDWQPPYPGPGWLGDIDAEPRDPMYDSSGITLRSWVSISDFVAAGAAGTTRTSNCWGYTSPNGREYAIIGLETGVAFVEITNPGNAQIVKILSAPSSIWNEQKTYQNYAYSVSEGGQGVKVFNLSNIDGTGSNRVTWVRDVTAPDTSATHTVTVDTDSGFLYRNGGGNNGLRIYSLSNPSNPSFVGSWSTRYVHDSQVVTYTSGPYAGKQIAFCYTGFNGGFTEPGIDILDVTSKSNIIDLGRIVYPGGKFSHQAWLSADKRLLYLDDELDEPDVRTTTYIFDVSNLSNPTFVRTFNNNNSAIGHNLYLRNCLIYEANYTSGLRLFSLANPYAPVEVGYFDTSSDYTGATFNGAWGVYPFFPSGSVIISDIERGLFVLDVSAVSNGMTCETTTINYPFSDNFTAATVNSTLWSGNDGATISTQGISPPSGPNSLKLGGSAAGGNAIRTSLMNLTNTVNPALTFWYQRTGNGDSPEPDDDLVVEYINSSSQWIELARELGDGPDGQPFQSVTIPLPLAAKHFGSRIRFRVISNQPGADNWYIDNVSLNVGDSIPPSPAPTFSVPPTPLSSTEITMQTTSATDASGGVEYYFDFDTGGAGGSDSGWQSSTTYTDTGLSPNLTYSYRVKARDAAISIPNETPLNPTPPAVGAVTATLLQTPTTMTFSNVTETSFDVTADGFFSFLTVQSSGLYFEMTPAIGSGANVWMQSQTIHVTGLDAGTQYSFRLRGRNRYGALTEFSPPALISTVAVPVPCVTLGDMNSDSLLDGNDVAGFARVKLGTPDVSDHVECADFGNAGDLDLDTAAFVAVLLAE